MTIRDDARAEAEQRSDDAFPQTPLAPENEQRADDYSDGFIAGALWASEQADREPSDGEVLCECGFSEDLHDGEFDAACETFRPDREPSDAEVTDEMARAALNAFYPDYATKAPNGWTFVNIWAMKAALIAAQEVNRGSA